MSGMAFVCSKPQPDAEANLDRRAASIGLARSGRSTALFYGMTQTLIGATARERRPEIVAELRTHMTLTDEALVAVQAGLATRPDSVPTVAPSTCRCWQLLAGKTLEFLWRRWKHSMLHLVGANFICCQMQAISQPMNNRSKLQRCWRSGYDNQRLERQISQRSIFDNATKRRIRNFAIFHHRDCP